MTLRAIIILCLSVHATVIFAQKRSNPLATPDVDHLPSVTLVLRNKDSAVYSHGGAFCRFRVIDSRPDTTRIGIHLEGDFSRERHCQLVFAHHAATTLENDLNSHFANPQARDTALVILRVLWLSDPNYVHAEFEKEPDRLLD